MSDVTEYIVRRPDAIKQQMDPRRGGYRRPLKSYREDGSGAILLWWRCEAPIGSHSAIPGR